MTTRQTEVPHGLGRGDKVIFKRGWDRDELLHGVVLDILSTQFLINDANNVTHIVAFKYVEPEKA